MSFGRRHFGALGALAATAACSAVLGDFTVGNAPPPGPDGSSDAAPGVDAPTADGNLPQDAQQPDAGDAPSGMLACDRWRYTNPILVEDLSLAPKPRRFTGKMAVFPGPLGTTRIVAAKSGTPGDSMPAYSVYTITKTSMAVQQLDAPASVLPVVVDVHHASSSAGGFGGTTAVVTRRLPDGGGVTSYDVVAFDDLMSATGPLSASFPLYTLTATQTTNSVSVLPFSTTDVFEAISTGTGSPTTYTLGVGRVSPTSAPSMLATVATSVSAASFSAPKMIHVNGNVYMTNANDLTTPGCTGYTVADTAVVPSPPQPQVISSGQDLVVNALAASAAVNAATDVLMLQTDFNAQFATGYKYKAGVVADSMLSTWTSGDLPDIPGPAGVLFAPVGVPPGASWQGDDVMMIGPGLRIAAPDGGVAMMEPGLNLVWINASEGIRSVQSGATAILADRNDFFAVAAVPGNPGLSPPNWDVVWVEDIADGDGGTHHVLRMNQLLCH